MDAFRVVVIGAGVAGASTAFALARRGAVVTLVDAAHVGKATAAGAGIIQPWGSSTSGAFYDLYAAGADHYPTLIAELADVAARSDHPEPDIGFRRCGALVVNRETSVLDEVEAVVRRRAPRAPLIGDVTRLDNAGARSLFPPLGRDYEALHLSGGARVDGRMLCRALVEALVLLGGEVIDGTAVLREHSAGVALDIDGQRRPADAIVLAGGAWSNAVLAPLGLHVDLEPQRGQITHLLLDGVDTSMWPSISPVADHYMVAFDDSRIVVGATRETCSGFDPRITAAGQRHVLDNALELAPGLADATLIETRVGLRPMPSDGQPIIGEVEGFDGLFVASGFGAVGLTIAPYVGARLSELILERVLTSEVAAFAPRITTR